MIRFSTQRDAKTYLIAELLAQAERTGVSLSEVERGMLSFSETGESPPNIMEINEAFERDYDQAQYEAKIGGLARGASQSEPATWAHAVRTLRAEDHYLLICIDPRNAAAHSRLPGRPVLADSLKLFATALTICLVILAAFLYFASRHPAP